VKLRSMAAEMFHADRGKDSRKHRQTWRS